MLKKRLSFVALMLFLGVGLPACAVQPDKEGMTESKVMACSADQEIPCTPKLILDSYGREILARWWPLVGPDPEWYELQRKTSTTAYETIGDPFPYELAGEVTYIDKGMPLGNYTYRVRSCNWAGCSSYSGASTQVFTPSVSCVSVNDPARIAIGGGTDVAGMFDCLATGISQDLQAVMISWGFYNSVQPHQTLSLHNGSGTLVAGPVTPDPIYGTSAFSGFHLPLIRNVATRVVVKGLIKPVGPGGVHTGAMQLLYLLNGVGSTREIGSFKSVGTYPSGAAFIATSSSNTYDAQGSLRVVRKAKPVFALAPLQSQRLGNGWRTAMSFTATAEGDSVLQKTFGFVMFISDHGGAALKPMIPVLQEVSSPTTIPGYSDIAIQPDCQAAGTNKLCIFRVTTASPLLLVPGVIRTFNLSVWFEGAEGHLNDRIDTGFWEDYNAAFMTGELHQMATSVAGVAFVDSLMDYYPPLPDGTFHGWSDRSEGASLVVGQMLGVQENGLAAGTVDWTNGTLLGVPVMRQSLTPFAAKIVPPEWPNGWVNTNAKLFMEMPLQNGGMGNWDGMKDWRGGVLAPRQPLAH